MSRLPPASPEEARLLEWMRAVERAGPVDELELARARVRLGARAWRGRPRGLGRRLVWGGASVLVASGALAFGMAHEQLIQPSTRVEGQPVEVSEPPAPSPPHRPTVPETAPSSVSEEPAREVSSDQGSPLPVSRPVGPEAQLSASSAPPSSGWSSVARALRTGDRAEAERQLVRLVESSRGADRDAARLALAQLRLSSGDAEGARRSLNRLSRSSVDPLVADRARELLGRLPSRTTRSSPECASQDCPNERSSGTKAGGGSP